MNKYLTGFQLKIIGLMTMVIDHLAEFFNFLGVPLWFHWIGRITAPIFYLKVLKVLFIRVIEKIYVAITRRLLGNEFNKSSIE